MFLPYLVGSLLLLAQPILAQFSLYPDIPSDLFATALNISSGCLTALNATVDCDGTLFQMAGNADGYFWSNDNATALCTSQCLSSAASWWSQSASACEDDVLNAYGRLYPAETVPGRFLDGLNIVCVTADTDLTQDVGINGTIITFTDLGGVNSTVDPTFADPQVVPDTPLQGRQVSGDSSYCLVQSYSWVGSDVIRPDCEDAANAQESQCIDPTEIPAENSRIANLYPDSLLCSPCFLKMFYLRLASPYLPDVDTSDFMIEQWYDILDVCDANSTMPELIVRLLPSYQAAPGDSTGGSDNTTQSWTPTPADSTTCSGRVIVLADLEEPTIDYDTQTPCDVIPPYLEASTGDVIQTMGSPSCLPILNNTVMPSICLPLSCEVAKMPNYTTCDLFAQSLSTSNTTVTTTQLLTWNPHFVGLCSNTTEQYVCAGAPGGTYIPPEASNATSSASSQQRGGGNGSGTSTGSGGVGGSSRNSTYVDPGETAPSPTQSGIAASCTRYAVAESGDGCTSFASSFSITLQSLVTWNPILGVDGANCATMLEAGVYYCIGVSGTSTTTSAATSTSATVSTPTPIQSGTISSCNKFAEAVSGEYCSAFATEYSITTDQLYAWNPILGVNGANCDTEFQANVYYCVGVASAAATATTSKASTMTTSKATSTTSVTAPGPTQTGIISTCNKYAEAVSGDGCETFASEHGITATQLYAWNPVLGTNGANCSTQLWVQEYYCVGVAS